MLRLKRDFDRVKKHGRRLNGRMMTLNVVPTEEEHSRLGIIVSRRYDTHAVERNRARRLIRESFRCLRHRLSESVWLIVIARRAMHGKSMAAVQSEMSRLLSGFGVLPVGPAPREGLEPRDPAE